MTRYILALDQGTTSSRAIVFDHAGRPVAKAQQEFPQILPRPGDVEHDPEAIWSSQLAVAREALAQAGLEARDIAAIGVTNQRETTILWERATGRPVANAIVWQSRVSAPDLRAAEGRRAGATVSRADRPGRRRLFLRHQDQAPARHDRRPARPGRARRNPVRHGRYLAALAADRRPAARDRLQQRQPHAAVQHSHARLGRRAAADPRHPAGDAARGPLLERALWRNRRPSGSARRFRWPAARAISRRPRSARPVSSPAAPRTPTAPAAFCC